MLVLVIEAIRASAILLSITSTTTVRHGGLSTSTRKSLDQTMHRSAQSAALKMAPFLAATRCWLPLDRFQGLYIQVPLRNSSSMSTDGSLSDWRSARLAQNSNDSSS